MSTQITALFSQSNMEIAEVAYPLENCEVAKVESPMSANKPAITFNRLYIYVNAKLLKCAPEMVYVQFLIDREARKLILRHCDKRERGAVRLRTLSETNTKPRRILAGEFNCRFFEYMRWDKNYRYKVIGNLINSNGETLLVFDLTSAERFELPDKGEIAIQKPSGYVLQLSGSFGATFEDYLANPLVTKFADDTMIPVETQDNAMKSANGFDRADMFTQTENVMSAPEVTQ